jgi:hypothetical protein
MKWQEKGILWCCVSSLLFSTVLGCLIASCVYGKFNGSTIIYTGNCEFSVQINAGIHVVISVVTLLVTISSDFFLRLISAPQHQDIKAAHHEAQWMDIGINSLRNLISMSLGRKCLWMLLILSSIPVQLFSNASVFSTATSTDYTQLLVSKGFVQGEPFMYPGVALLTTSNWWRDNMVEFAPMFQAMQGNSSGFYWTRLDNIECQQIYLASQHGLQFYRNLVIVIEAGSSSNSVGWTDNEIWNGTLPAFYNNTWTDDYFPNMTNSLWSFETRCGVGNNLGTTWNVCSDAFGYDPLLTNGNWNFSDNVQYQWIRSPGFAKYYPNFNLTYNNITVLFCVAEPFESPCKIEVSNELVFAVCLCIFLKCGFAVATLILLWKTKPIHCLGDALQQFMEQEEDTQTIGLCTFDQSNFRRQSRKQVYKSTDDMRPRWIGQPRAWASYKKHWGTALPQTVWYTTYLPIIIVIVIAACLLSMGIQANAWRNRGPL